MTATDANGCSAIATVIITEPVVLSASISAQNNVLCNGASTGSATVMAAGGTTAYTYLWTGGQTTATAVNLAAGTYTVTVTDARNCTAIATVFMFNFYLTIIIYITFWSSFFKFCFSIRFFNKWNFIKK